MNIVRFGISPFMDTGVLLDKEKLMPIAESLPYLWKDFEFEMGAFINSFGNESSSSE